MEVYLQLQFHRKNSNFGRLSIYELVRDLPKPTLIWEKDEKNKSDGFYYQHKFKCGGYFDDEIVEFLEPFHKIRDKIVKTENLDKPNDSYCVSFKVIFYAEKANPGFNFSKEVVRMLADFNADVDFDLYFIGEEDCL